LHSLPRQLSVQLGPSTSAQGLRVKAKGAVFDHVPHWLHIINVDSMVSIVDSCRTIASCRCNGQEKENKFHLPETNAAALYQQTHNAQYNMPAKLG
jgi:hypothetical protein